MTTGADVLRDAFAASCKSLDRILDGVSDEEFFWEPVAGCWTVHRRSESRGVSADGSGDWVIDWDPAQPKPAPFTTIAWRAVHTAGTNYLYWEYAFGSASPTFDLELPGNAADATRFCPTASARSRRRLPACPSRISTRWFGTPQVGSGRCTVSSRA